MATILHMNDTKVLFEIGLEVSPSEAVARDAVEQQRWRFAL
jgi:hypothetical protein